VKWLFNEDTLPSNVETSRSKSVHMLKINGVTKHNVGKYSCEGEDAEYSYFKTYVELTLDSK